MREYNRRHDLPSFPAVASWYYLRFAAYHIQNISAYSIHIDLY